MTFLHKYRIGVFLGLLSFFNIEVRAQRFLSVVFDNLPQDRQMYARDDNNEAVVPVSGIIEVPDFTHMSIIIYRDGVRSGYVKSELNYAAGSRSTNFTMSPKIKSELSEYTFEVYACKAQADSFLMVKREQILAGDFYIINGQSNAAATNRYSVTAPDYVEQYSRTIGRTPDGNPGMTAADTSWKSPSWVTPEEGYWGRDLQRLIIETHKIPVCIINGAIPGTYIDNHLIRNASNPAEPSSIYGHLLYRTRKSKATRIRGFFWYQGEEDAWSNPGAYPAKLDQLIKYWQTDYLAVDRFIIVQINVLDRPHYLAGAMREFQRQTKFNYPKTDHFAVMGLSPMEDGVHYTAEGYGKLARQFFSFLGPKVYKSTSDRNIESPDIKKVFYTSTKEEIVMEFDEKQDLKWPNDTTSNGIVIRMRDQFFLDGNESTPASLTSWTVEKNRIILRLNTPVNATKLNYLPSYRLGYYPGPFIKNTNGLGAFSFHEFPIANAIPSNNLKATVSDANIVHLTWQKNDATSFILQKKAPGDATYNIIKTFNSDITSYDDLEVGIDMSYSYRIMSSNPTSESPYSEATIKTMPLLSAEPTIDIKWKVYPNPTSDMLEVEFVNPVSGNLKLISSFGKHLTSIDINNQKTTTLKIRNHPAGIYVVVFKDKRGFEIIRRIVKF